MVSRRVVRKKTIEVAGLTLLSRLLGLTRDLLMSRYLGATALSDAFVTAFRLPNSLRKIFAEGAMSAALVPTMVQSYKDEGRPAINKLTTYGLLIFEGLVLLTTIMVIVGADTVAHWLAPGFSPAQVAATASFLRILMLFLLTISSSAILAGAFQSVDHFFTPAFGPVVINMVFIAGLAICYWFALPPVVLCWFVLGAGVAQMLVHFATYYRLGFGFCWVNGKEFRTFLPVMHKFVLSCVSMSAIEMGLVIDGMFASYLSKGTVTLLYYANRWMGVPHGVFAIALSTVLLPQFARYSQQSTEKVSFYLLEASKMVAWVTLPTMLGMWFFADKIFYTVHLSPKFPLASANEGAFLLQIFLMGLFFCSINKILLSVFYAFHSTGIPAVVVMAATLSNVALNALLIGPFQSAGLAAATALSWTVQTGLLIFLLARLFDVHIDRKMFGSFVMRYAAQVAVVGAPFLGLYLLLLAFITHAVPAYISYLLLDTVLLWSWVGLLGYLFVRVLLYTRKWFGIQLHFME